MDELIQIRLSDENLCDLENKNKLFKFYYGLVDLARENRLWAGSIKAIVITDNLEIEIKKQALIWNTRYQISKEKEFRVASKVLFR